MGKRGPAPKTTALKVLEGNPSRRPMDPNEPMPPSDLFPKSPKWLSPQAEKIWENESKVLMPLGLLTKADYHAFGRWCEMLTEWIKAKEFIQEHGQTYPIYEHVEVLGPDGRPQLGKDDKPILKKRLKYMGQCPQVAIFRNLAVEMRQIEQEFGMTPASRTRISVDPEKARKSRADKFKRSKRG